MAASPVASTSPALVLINPGGPSISPALLQAVNQFINDFDGFANSGKLAQAGATLQSDLAAITLAAGAPGARAVGVLSNDVNSIVEGGTFNQQQATLLNGDLAGVLGVPGLTLAAITSSIGGPVTANRVAGLPPTELNQVLTDINAVGTATSQVPRGQSGGEAATTSSPLSLPGRSRPPRPRAPIPGFWMT